MSRKEEHRQPSSAAVSVGTDGGAVTLRVGEGEAARLSREAAQELLARLHEALAALPGPVRYRTSCPDCGADLQVFITAQAAAIPLRAGGYDDFEAGQYEVVDQDVYCTGPARHSFALDELELRDGATAGIGA